MEDANLDAAPDWPDSRESPAERLARIAREAAILAQAEADIANGLGIDGADMVRWLRARDRGENPPRPQPRKRSVAVR